MPVNYRLFWGLLKFTTEEEKIQFNFESNELLSGFSRLISSILEYMPDNNSLYIKADVIKKEDALMVIVTVIEDGREYSVRNSRVIKIAVKMEHV